MNQEDRKKYLKAKLIEKSCTEEELRELYFLISQSGSVKESESLFEQIWNQQQIQFTIDDDASDLLYNQIRQRVKPETKKETGFSWDPMLKVAASVALISSLAALLFYLLPSQSSGKLETITKSTERGQRAVIHLSDGTVVTLNAESSIIYPAKFPEGSRDVKLNGEAFFEVVKDKSKPFSVEAAGLVTRVLGTSFNIKAYNDETVDVTVATGKVKVVPKEAMMPADSAALSRVEEGAKILVPNQQASFNPADRSITVKEVQISPYLAWTSKTLHFDMEPFAEVVNTLQRWYNIEVELKNPEAGRECLVRARYEKESLENVLKGLQLLVDFEYQFINSKKVVITMEKCKN